MDPSFQFIVVNCDGGLCFHNVSKYIRLLQTDGELKGFACLGEVVYQVLELLLSMQYHCNIIGKEYVPDEGLVYIVYISPSVEVDAFS